MKCNVYADNRKRNKSPLQLDIAAKWVKFYKTQGSINVHLEVV